MSVSEVLRWRSPVVDTVRELTEPTEVAGRTLGPGTLVMVSPYLVHHHAELYPSPAAFVPDRFVGSPVPDPRSWIPFGGGARRCLGAELAVMEMQIVLAELLGLYRLTASSAPGERARLAGTVLVPAGGASVVVSGVSGSAPAQR